jgi:hypothetical protein
MTWVTVSLVASEDFHGYAVEKHIYHWAAVAIDSGFAPQ